MKVLVGCEFSQVVTKAFRDRGFEAYSCDLLPTEGNSDWHIQGDVLDYLEDGWDLAVFFPPCTYLCNSGVRWLYTQKGRLDKLNNAAVFFRKLLNAPIPKICAENPIPHTYAIAIIGRKYDQLIQPWMFGHGETKATCLWLKNLPKLEPTNIVNGREGRVWKESPGKDRWKRRSRTYQGIAEAMAEQWGKILVRDEKQSELS
jgi:hypothetical protein